MSKPLYSLEANEPVLLNDPKTVWVVQSGTLAVFAAIKNRTVEEHRRYLFHVSAGEGLFGAALLPEVVAPNQWGFVAVAIETAQLSQMSTVDLMRKVAVADPQAIALLEGWVNHLGQSLTTQQTVLAMPLNLVEAFEADFSLSNGEAVLWQQTLVWVKLHEGSIRWMGVEESKLNSTSPMFPVTSGMWLEAENPVIGHILLTADIKNIEEILTSLVCFHTCFFEYFKLLANKEAEAQFRQFQEREQFNQQVIENALSDLATVLQPEPEVAFFEDGPPLLVALGAVGRALGIEIRPPAEDFSAIQDPVAAIARASQIRIRRVTLASGWWRQDQGPMLAYTELEKRPVALLPRENRDYVIFDPVARTRTPVNESVAKTLTATAYILYRPLPQVALKAIDLLRFGIKGYEKDVVNIFVVGILGTILGMVAPQATAILINNAIPEGDRALLWQIGLVLFAVAFAQFAFEIAQSFITLRIESATNSALQPAIWDRLLRLSPGFFRQYTSGDLVNRVMAVREIHQKVSGATQRTLLSGIFALFNLVLMFIYSWQLGFVEVGLTIFAAVFTVVSSFLLVKKSQKQLELDGAIQGLSVQLINGVAKLRVAMAEERAFAAWAKKYSQQIRLKASWQQIKDGVSIFNEALPLVNSILIFGVMLLMQTRLTLGTFVAFNYAATIFLKGVIDLSNTASEIWSIVPIWERAKPIWRSQPEYDPTKLNPGKLNGQIALERVSFRYSENGGLILNDVSIHAEPGEFIAIVGPSGSGKSTILRLLLGFETPLTGNVYYDGKDLAQMELQAVRRQLGVVLQNGKIGTGSIFQNITAGALVSLEEAWLAAQMAGLADDIKQMPMGMHTIIAEGGSNLSGGQRQRLLIARSLVSKPKIILMDEATSALDNRSQAIVTESLAKLNATRVVIAHRLSTIRHADRIYVIDAGHVLQVGNFSELIAQEGLFARLVARQLESNV